MSLMATATRRRLLQLSALGAIAATVPRRGAADETHSDEWESSPELDKFVQPMPVPRERTPDGTRRGVDYHRVPILESTQQFHPDLGETTIWGFDGQFPGPILSGRRGTALRVEIDNSRLPDEHLFDVDERIDGTTAENYVGYDGPVPDVRTATHFHGLNVAPESDGQADMWRSPSGVTGPRFARDVQEQPNRQPRLTSVYHDHTRGISRLNNYAGLVGPYYVRSRDEARLDLPEGDYDVPLVLADRSFTEDGELYYPSTFVPNFAGDTATVNGAAWPYLEVEPRRYRFRIQNVSNGRTYDLGLQHEDDGGHEDGHGHAHDESGDVPTLHQISPGHGFLEEVVSIGPGGALPSLVLAPFERADVVVDFSGYAGETFTVTNDAEFPYRGGMDHDGSDGHGTGGDGMGDVETGDGVDHGDGDMDHGDGGMDHGDGDHPQIREIVQIRVGTDTGGRDGSTDPAELTLPKRSGPNPNAAGTTREVTMQMGMDDHGLMIHTLNGRRWGDEVSIQPQLGTTEIWELVNDDDHTHPIHLHLVAFDVLSRERHDGDRGPQPPLANERGGKDVVRVNPGETVRIAVRFGDFAGRFPFHCHVLEHEEHAMMRPFEVVRGSRRDGAGGDDGHPGRSERSRGERPGNAGPDTRPPNAGRGESPRDTDSGRNPWWGGWDERSWWGDRIPWLDARRGN